MMDTAYRQMVRNLLVIIAVILIPVFSVGTQPLLSWILRHSIFFFFWTSCMILIGTAAQKIANDRGLQWFLIRRAGLDPESLTASQMRALPAFSRIPIFWSGCSRCISYSIGGALSFVMAMLYFGRGVVPGLYFALLGGPAAALTASVYELLQAVREEK